jgi:hypothetical protein
MLRYNAQGYYSWIVLDEQDKIVRFAKTFQKNLILTQGLDGIAVRSWADSFVACAVGTGSSTPVPTQIGLDNEIRRTTTYLDMVEANSTSLVDNVYTLRRTFVFPKEGSDTTYSEMGFSYSTTGPNALFSRVRLPNIQISAGERFIVQYELVITISPKTAVVKTNPVSGHDSSGTFAYQKIGLKGVNSLGQTYNFDDAEGCNEPSTITKAFLSTDASAPASFGSCISRSGTTLAKDVTLSTYAAGSFTREKIFSVGQKEGLQTWVCGGLGSATNPQQHTGLVYVYNTPFIKPQGSVIFKFRFTWASKIKENYEVLFYWQNEDEMMLRKQNPLLSYFGLKDD